MMMHGFGFPFFMGGPIVWLILLIGGYFLIRRFIIPYTHEESRGTRESSRRSIETDIYRLAAKRNGNITVSDVVTELGIEPRKAENILESMSDGMRVRMEVGENGNVYYSSPELRRRA
ncbi:MAG: hypothetical protein K9L66_05415 [Spirochaetaceae bacterium]|nr:hypothetical protein [Spirochaetaceae bacterium]MCF7938664.1 hypothetical protein [Spirochaetales bacterium]